MNAILSWLRGLIDAWLSSRSAAASTPAPPSATPPLLLAPEDVPTEVAPVAPALPSSLGPRQINAAGLALVKKSEGLRLAAYQDTGGVWTIGYGHTGAYPDAWRAFSSHPWLRVGAGDAITSSDAEALLGSDLWGAEDVVAAVPGVASLTDNQFSALVDFTFNLGPSALRQLLAHGLDQVPEQLLRWDHGEVGGHEEELAGLKVRRQAEVDLWRRA